MSTFSTLGNIALSYDRLNDIENANLNYLKTLKIIEEKLGRDNIYYALNLSNYGTFLINKKDDRIKSFECLSEALAIYKSIFSSKSTDLAFIYNRIGDYYLKTEDYSRALLNFQKSIVSITENFDDTTEFSNPDPASVISKSHYLRALKNKIIAFNKLAENENNIALFEKSKQTCQIAIDVMHHIRSGFLSEQSKLFLAENEQDIYHLVLETCYTLYIKTGDKKYIEESFRFAESGKSAVLADAMQNNAALIHGNIPQEIINKIDSINRRMWMVEELIFEENRKKEPNKPNIDQWNTSLFELSEKNAQLNKQIETDYPQYFNLKYGKSIPEIKQIQSKLRKEDVIIEYFLQSKSLYTFIISENKLQLNHQPVDTGFHRSIDQLINSLTDNNFSKHTMNCFEQFKSASYTLYAKLIAPFAESIKGKQLIIIPDGKLAYIPFDVLIKENKPSKIINYYSLPYLLYDYPISYSYSAKTMVDKSEKHKNPPFNLIAFAPEYNTTVDFGTEPNQTRQQYRENLYPLKGIKEEAIIVANLLNGDLLLDTMATERNFKLLAESYHILHLAMHTILNDKEPMFSKMAFSATNDSTEDGFLNTFEIYNLHLNSEMAVLSSCNTGSGLLNNGEGVMSLARGFIFAGCPSIIMTLWTVEDKSGVQLMTHFYKSLKKGNNKALALQHSKIEFLKYADPLKSHPYYWAGYVAIGNKQPLFNPTYYYFVFGLILLGSFLFIFWRLRSKKH